MQQLIFNGFRKSSLSSFILLLYFMTTCADKLNFSFGLFRGKLSNFIALGLFTLILVQKRRIYLSKHLLIWSALIFLSMLLSLSQAAHLKRSIGYIVVYVIEFLLYFLLTYNLVHFYDRKKVSKVYCLSFLVVGFYGFLQLTFSLFGLVDPLAGQFILGDVVRPNAWAYEPSYLALYLTIGTAYINSLFFFESKLTRSDFFALCSLNLFLILTTSTGGFLSYFVLILFVAAAVKFVKKRITMYFVKRLKKALFWVGATGMLTVFVMPNLVFKFYLKAFHSDFSTHHSFVIRWDGIVRAYQTFLDRPIIGVGVGGIGPYNIQQKRIISKSESALDNLALLEEYDAQNVTTEVMACLGLIGSLLIFSLMLYPLHLMYRIYRSTTIIESDKKICLAWCVSYLVVMIELQISPGLFRNYIWANFGFICGYYISILREQPGVRRWHKHSLLSYEKLESAP